MGPVTTGVASQNRPTAASPEPAGQRANPSQSRTAAGVDSGSSAAGYEVVAGSSKQAQGPKPGAPSAGTGLKQLASARHSSRNAAHTASGSQAPRIVFVPENHSYGPMVDRREKLVGLAWSGDIFLATEGLVRGREKAFYEAGVKRGHLPPCSNPKQFGVEDAGVFAVVIGFTTYTALAQAIASGDLSTATNMAYRLVNDVRYDGPYHQAWQKAWQEMVATGHQGAAACLEHLRHLPPDELKGNLSATLADPTKLMMAFKCLFQEIRKGHPYLAPDTDAGKSYTDFLNNPSDEGKTEKTFLWHVAGEFRHRSIAKNILEAYKEASQQRRDLFVTIGGAHVLGLAGMLRDVAPEVPVASASFDFAVATALKTTPREKLPEVLGKAWNLQALHGPTRPKRPKRRQSKRPSSKPQHAPVQRS